MLIRSARAFLIALLVILAGLPTVSYVMLSTRWAQQRLRDASEQVLHSLLGTEAEVGEVCFTPFNRIRLKNVSVTDDAKQRCLSIDEIEVRLELLDLIMSHRVIVDYVSVDGLQLSLSREAPGGELNIAGIIRRFGGKPKKAESNFDVTVNSFSITNGSLSYDVKSEPPAPVGVFDANHVRLSGLAFVAYAPAISNDIMRFDLRHLSFTEQSGFVLADFKTDFGLSKDALTMQRLEIVLPQSRLALEEMIVPLDGFSSLKTIGVSSPVDVSLDEGSHIYLPDIKAFVPQLEDIDWDLYVTLRASGMLSSIDVKEMLITDRRGLVSIGLSGKIDSLPSMDRLTIHDVNLSAKVSTSATRMLLGAFDAGLPPVAERIADGSGMLDVRGFFDGTLAAGSGRVEVISDFGSAQASGRYRKFARGLRLDADISTSALDLGQIIGNAALGAATLSVDADMTVRGKKAVGKATVDVASLAFRDYEYHDISVVADANDSVLNATLYSKDPNLDFRSTGYAKQQPDGGWQLYLYGDLLRADLAATNLWKAHPGKSMKVKAYANATVHSTSRYQGKLGLYDLDYTDSIGAGVFVDSLEVFMEKDSDFGQIILKSDSINGEVEGRFDLATLVPTCRGILNNAFPVAFGLDPDVMAHVPAGNELAFDIEILRCENICKLFSLPIAILDPMTISGEVSSERQNVSVQVDAPYIMQGSALVRETLAHVEANGLNRSGTAYLGTLYPTKKGDMDVKARIDASHGSVVGTVVDWNIIRDIAINGQIGFTTTLRRVPDGALGVDVEMKPGKINFGNEVWNIQPSRISYAEGVARVDHFALKAPTQSIDIDGVVGPDEDDVLEVKLRDIRMLEIFETLGIDKALICGNATGEVTARALMSKTPQIESRGFHVSDIGYNGCVLGDADVDLGFDNEKLAFTFDADIAQPDGRHSFIDGHIIPATEELDLRFKADKVRVGFLKPFISAFCSDIDGHASGSARLFGTFKCIDLVGDIYADNVKLKIGYTGVWYQASDSLHIRPGYIDLNNIHLSDMQGHRALLNGWVRHVYFKDPVTFDFTVTVPEDASILCYDVAQRPGEQWWGTVYGSDGWARITGRPGMVDITARMVTAPKSKFTFSLTDEQEALEYSFITFRDKTPIEELDINVEAESVKRHRALAQSSADASATDYNLDFQIDVRDNAELVLVMDPVAGDAITAHGAGTVKLTYGSANEDLRMIGNYRLSRGTYNFTLQDIIIRPFKIKEGSEITFTGDPFDAQLNIVAAYETTANLSDLDESFLSDKDLNRTSTPVEALLKVNGSINEPDITFDLGFPKMREDVERKVRSIVSTDDMMNQQIIYLLALNRFYTPDYVAATKGSELFSVASSTIASQLSSMLGKLSDKWSIAPNLRSDRGDFSDVEVDVNLSSRLLNNRLLFNGNFGYRDKSLNTNQFVGDFDIEYLLNAPGTIRLKTYNRFNDQNYYLRTAQTTQGVGVLWRKDFDSFKDLFRSGKERTDSVQPDSTKTKKQNIQEK